MYPDFKKGKFDRLVDSNAPNIDMQKFPVLASLSATIKAW